MYIFSSRHMRNTYPKRTGISLPSQVILSVKAYLQEQEHYVEEALYKEHECTVTGIHPRKWEVDPTQLQRRFRLELSFE